MIDNITKLSLSHNKRSEEILDHFKIYDKKSKTNILNPKYDYLFIVIKDN